MYKLFQNLIPEFECVTIFFGEIIGLRDLTSNCTPTELSILVMISVLFFLLQLIDFFNLFHNNIDMRLSQFHVYSLHTMGDDLMVVSGMPQLNGAKEKVPILNEYQH